MEYGDKFLQDVHKELAVTYGDAAIADPEGPPPTTILPIGERGRMPLTKDKYLGRENPHKVRWERVVRQFAQRLGRTTGHRISAPMVYEWATGSSVKEVMDAGISPNSDLRHINFALKYYFGEPRATFIAGKKVGKAYRVPAGTIIRRRRPHSNELYVEYLEGVLDPPLKEQE